MLFHSGDPMIKTQYIVVLKTDSDEANELSIFAQKNGKDTRIRKIETFSFCFDLVDKNATRFNFEGQDPKP